MAAPTPRQGILTLTIKDKSALYVAYMPFIKNGGLFIPTSKPYRLGDEVFILLTLMDHAKADSPRVKNVVLAVDLARHSGNGWDDAALPDDFKAIEELLHIGHDALLHKLGVEPPADDQPQ